MENEDLLQDLNAVEYIIQVFGPWVTSLTCH